MLVMSFIVHIFFAYIFICFLIPFVCPVNDFNEVYSYLWMAVYNGCTSMLANTSLHQYSVKAVYHVYRLDVRSIEFSSKY